ncbi:NAD-dependent epimerase/dehydratase family protein [Streptomyces sp. NPDC058864]
MSHPLHRAPELDGARVLVTGGAGLVGSRIVRDLAAAGAHPTVVCTLNAYPAAVYRDQFGIDVAGPQVVTGDIRDRDLMDRLAGQADYIVHAAALADVAACTRTPHAAIDTNVTGTQVVLDAAAASSRTRRLLFVSSASVYGNGNSSDQTPPTDETRTMCQLLETVYGRTPVRFDEDTPLRPLSVYGNTKPWGETQTALTLDAADTSFTVLRYFSVYGEPQVIKPGSHSWVVAWFAARAAVGLPLHLNGGGHQVRDLVHVDDIAEATCRVLTAPRAHRQTLNVGTGTPTSIRQVADLIAYRYPGTRTESSPLPPGDPLGGYAGTTRLHDTLGWKPGITICDGIERYTAWLARHPTAIPDWLRTEATTAT